jgi:hypothetical protein
VLLGVASCVTYIGVSHDRSLQVLPTLGKLLVWYDPQLLLAVWQRAQQADDACSSATQAASAERRQATNTLCIACELLRAAVLHVQHIREVYTAANTTATAAACSRSDSSGDNSNSGGRWGSSHDGIQDSGCCVDIEAATTAAATAAAAAAVDGSSAVAATTAVNTLLLESSAVTEQLQPIVTSLSHCAVQRNTVVIGLVEVDVLLRASSAVSTSSDVAALHDVSAVANQLQLLHSTVTGITTAAADALQLITPYSCCAHSIAAQLPLPLARHALLLDRLLSAALVRVLPHYCSTAAVPAAAARPLLVPALVQWLSAQDDVRWTATTPADATTKLLSALAAALSCSVNTDNHEQQCGTPFDSTCSATAASQLAAVVAPALAAAAELCVVTCVRLLQQQNSSCIEPAVLPLVCTVCSRALVLCSLESTKRCTLLGGLLQALLAYISRLALVDAVVLAASSDGDAVAATSVTVCQLTAVTDGARSRLGSGSSFSSSSSSGSG